jgi:hypothetical protein
MASGKEQVRPNNYIILQKKPSLPRKMRNVLIELNNHVANKAAAAAAAVISVTDPSDVAITVKAFEFALKVKRNIIPSEHILDDAFRKTSEKGPHEIAKPSYDDDVTMEGLLEEAHNFCDSIFSLKDKVEIGHMSVGLAYN